MVARAARIFARSGVVRRAELEWEEAVTYHGAIPRRHRVLAVFVEWIVAHGPTNSDEPIG
jgi:hypothetical protein